MSTTQVPSAKLHPTRHDLPEDKRRHLVQLLNQSLADLTDYTLQLKQAHWNVKGRQFVSLHEMFDEFIAQTLEFGDLVAERAVMLGGQARGTIQSVSTTTRLPGYPVEITSAGDHLDALGVSLGTLARSVREAIDEADKLGDADSADLFTEVSRGLDKQLWYVEAHLSD